MGNMQTAGKGSSQMRGLSAGAQHRIMEEAVEKAEAEVVEAAEESSGSSRDSGSQGRDRGRGRERSSSSRAFQTNNNRLFQKQEQANSSK